MELSGFCRDAGVTKFGCSVGLTSLQLGGLVWGSGWGCGHPEPIMCATGDQAGAKHDHSEPLQQPWEGGHSSAFIPFMRIKDVRAHRLVKAQSESGESNAEQRGATQSTIRGEMQSSAGATSPQSGRAMQSSAGFSVHNQGERAEQRGGLPIHITAGQRDRVKTWWGQA